MSKSWNPGKATVELRPSRIRREPVRLPTAAPPRSRESEIRAAVIGVAVIAAAAAALVVGMAQITSDGTSASAAPTQAAFGFCRGARADSCVIDGRSFRMAGQVIVVHGIDAPAIRPALCAEQARLGVEAAVRLRNLLNRGPVKLTSVAGARDGGALVRKVEVGGRDVAAAMVAAGVARDLSAPPRDWCAAPAVE